MNMALAAHEVLTAACLRLAKLERSVDRIAASPSI
jgi:hypothetical protein